MPESTPDQPATISLKELDDVLARAEDEQWRELALIGPDAWSGYGDALIRDGWPVAHVFRITDLLEGAVEKLASLTSLTSLDVGGEKTSPAPFLPLK